MKLTRRGMNILAVSAALYMGLGPSANARDIAALNALREGSMRKLVFHSDPVILQETTFFDFDGNPLDLAQWRGKVVFLNFWATWCGPCRKEMPMLSEIQEDMGGVDFEVLTLATGRNPGPAMQRFFEGLAIDNLPLYRDPKQATARSMGVLGLPTTVILNRQGQEVARLQGEADWSSASAKAILRRLIDG